MWFLGLSVGAIIGAIIGAIGDGAGAVVGAVVGAIAGALLSSASRKGAGDSDTARRIAELLRQNEHIYRCLGDVHNRLLALEEKRAVEQAQSHAGYARDPLSETGAPPLAPRDEPVVPSPAAVPAAAMSQERVDASAVGRMPPSAAPVEPGATPEAQPPVVAAAAGGREPPVGAEAIPGAGDNPVLRWLLGGNTLVRVGIVVLFIGVAFLLKYAAERDLFPIELRLAGVAAGGIALLAVGWRLRRARAGYALMLQGGGVGVLYLTVFAGLRLYKLLPGEFAFGLLAAIAAFSAVLAIVQDSRSLAITGVIGGFLAPIFASTGGGSHVALFSFYAVLNAGILGIAYYKAWRELNVVGFAFTFVIGLLWGAENYRPALFASTEPFLVLFFLFYVAIAVLFALRQAPRLTHYVDGTLVFGTPIVAFGLQAALVRGMEFAAAWSALALGAFYLFLAAAIYSRKRETLRMLVESFLALGVGFATLAVPLAFDGRWTSAVWAVEGAAVLWVGARQGRLLPRVFGILLQFAGGVAFLADVDKTSGALPILNSAYVGCVLVSLAGLFCSYWLERNRERVHASELTAARLLFAWGALWWFIGGLIEIDRHMPAAWGWNPTLLFFAGSCSVFHLLSRRLEWDIARCAALAHLPLMIAALIGIAFGLWRSVSLHPFAAHAYAGWTLGFAVHLWILRGHEDERALAIGRLHTLGFWLLAVVLSWEVGWQIDRYVAGRHAWPLVAWATVPGALIAVFAGRGERLGWPVATHRAAYLYAGAAPLAVFLLAWTLYVNLASDGNPAPLPYVPLLNPLDLAQAGALLATALWYLGAKRLGVSEQLPAPETALKVLGVVLFVALNGVLLRTLHHYADVPFRFDAMMRSVLVQAALSLFWSLLALAAMVIATRRALRVLWIIGAVLLGVVVAKLFLVDLANTGTVERVVSFIGVGVLVIVIGYFSPVPPRSGEKPA
jgi:uncharacterized membrane protein